MIRQNHARQDRANASTKKLSRGTFSPSNTVYILIVTIIKCDLTMYVLLVEIEQLEI